MLKQVTAQTAVCRCQVPGTLVGEDVKCFTQVHCPCCGLLCMKLYVSFLETN